MNKLLALADRVEKLTGPDREVDAEILMSLGLGKRFRGYVEAIGHQVSYKIESGMTAEEAIAAGCPKHMIASHYRAPSYTGSLDAAMSLVPKDHMWSVESTGFYARVECYPGAGESAALALTCAALRARAHGGGVMSSYSSMTDNPLVEAVGREGTPGPYIIVAGTIIGSLVPVPHGVELYEWYDQSQVDGPDYRFVAETETGTEEGRANAQKILAALRAIEDAGWKVVKKGENE